MSLTQGTATFPRNSTFLGKRRDRMHASGFGIVKPETLGILEFRLEEILEFAVPEPTLCYLNCLTLTNSIYSWKSRYQTTRDLRLCSEKLYALYKIHEKISATVDDKTWNPAYKHLVNGLPDVGTELNQTIGQIIPSIWGLFDLIGNYST
ncbi:unnamed protein product [Prunus armeniaca]|uniref:Uncharacterized protein n=1 Tax=Prunus armeniaca TaxID=36596 RepID=A0A6J5UYQ7_PRUAR|nr:unnamed protein product [Prunus armeniaca]CAB4311482.1 unnamed protein product [Prunus armeniaca]